MNLIKNCFLHGRYEGDECGGCAAMRKERGTDKDAELATLRAENERLRAVAEESLKVMRGSCEMSCAEDPAWYRGKVPSLAWDALCSALFDWDEKKTLAALDAARKEEA